MLHDELVKVKAQVEALLKQEVPAFNERAARAQRASGDLGLVHDGAEAMHSATARRIRVIQYRFVRRSWTPSLANEVPCSSCQPWRRLAVMSRQSSTMATGKPS